METFSALLVLCAGNSPVTGEFPSQRPVALSFDAFFDLCLNKHSLANFSVKENFSYCGGACQISTWYSLVTVQMMLTFRHFVFLLHMNWVLICMLVCERRRTNALHIHIVTETYIWASILIGMFTWYVTNTTFATIYVGRNYSRLSKASARWRQITTDCHNKNITDTFSCIPTVVCWDNDFMGDCLYA